MELAVEESGRIRKLSMLASHHETPKDIFANWPDSYYEEESLAKRRQYLNQLLSLHPESVSDQNRDALLNRRYGGKDETDLFIRAWMMIRIHENDRITFLNRKHIEKELRHNLTQLCVLDFEMSDELIREWRDFARKYLIICCESSSYRSVGFGLIHLNDEKSALKIASEIDLVTRIIPSRFSLESECQRFRDTVIQVYCGLLENGTEYWEKYNR
jgi:hypothetical protein